MSPVCICSCLILGKGCCQVYRPLRALSLHGGSITDSLQGPDPHDMFGCSVPFSLWVGCLFVATLSYYTTDYMRQGQDASEKRTERYVYDPTAGERLGLSRSSSY